MKDVGADPERLLKRLPLELNFPAGRNSHFRMRLPRLPAPWHLAAGLLGARGVGFAEKIGAVRFMRFLQACGYRLDEDCTVSTCSIAIASTGALRRYLWEALCLAALNTAPEQASAQIFVNTLRDTLGGGRAATDLLLPAADLDQVFPAAAARFIAAHGGKIRLSTRIEALTSGPSSLASASTAYSSPSARSTRRPCSPASRRRPKAHGCWPATLRADRHRLLRLSAAAAPAFPDARPGGAEQRPDRAVGFRSRHAVRHAGVIAFVLSGHGAWEELDNARAGERGSSAAANSAARDAAAPACIAQPHAALPGDYVAPTLAAAWPGDPRTRATFSGCRPKA
jgi:hypothetical protein